MDFEEVTPVRLYCPNCGHRITGYQSGDGALRSSCERCKVKIFSKCRNGREIDIKMMPAGQK